MQCSHHGLRLFLHNSEQRTRGAARHTPALLPVLQGSGTDVQKRGELSLRHSEGFAIGLHVRTRHLATRSDVHTDFGIDYGRPTIDCFS